MKKPFYIVIFITLLITLTPADAGEIQFVGVSGDLLLNVERHVRLVGRLRNEKDKPILAGERRRLESRVVSEIQQALEPFGYYNAEVSLSPTQVSEKYLYVITLNKPVKINRLNITLSANANKEDDFKAWRDRFPLEQGLPLDQSIYSTEKQSLLSSAIRLGYFDATYLKSEIVIDETRSFADIFLNFDSGKRYRLSDITVDWSTDSADGSKSQLSLEQGILNTLITLEKDQFYTADSLAKTQSNLLATPYFSAVDVRAGERNKSTSMIPVKITLTPNKRRAYNFAIGAGTDTGIRGSVGFENRRINRRGHNINLRAGGSEIQRTAILNYRIPLQRTLNDSLNFFTSLEEEFSDNRRFQATQIGSEWAVQWKESLLKFGLVANREKFVRLDDDLSESEINSDLLMPSISWERTKGDDVYFPTTGWSASASVRGASASLGSDIDLVQAILRGKILKPLGSGRLKFRAQFAGSLIDDTDELPESLGFLSGGDDSVRGYSFESIGVNQNGETTVAENLIVGSIEYEHPIKNGFSLAAFIDVGDAFNDSADLNKGAGLGLRWRLPFGALRLDAASALDLDGDPIRLHFSFGTDL